MPKETLDTHLAPQATPRSCERVFLTGWPMGSVFSSCHAFPHCRRKWDQTSVCPVQVLWQTLPLVPTDKTLGIG